MKPSVLDFKLEMKISQRIPKPEKPRTKKLSNPTSTSTKSIKKWPWPCHRVTQLAHGVGSSWTQNHWEQGHFYPTKGLTSNLYMVAVGSRPLMVYCQPWNFGVHHLHIFSQRRFAQVVLSFLQIFLPVSAFCQASTCSFLQFCPCSPHWFRKFWLDNQSSQMLHSRCGLCHVMGTDQVVTFTLAY